jgi:hypothetical protein
MRITRETLLKLAQDTANQRARSDLSILAVYLSGSLLDGEPLLGGTADIDLFFIHNEDPASDREVVRITDEVHLDIAHHGRKQYRQTRELRLHPWLGPRLYGCKILYDPQHFMDFTQASVRGQFFRPDQVLGRVRPQVERARQIWFTLTAVQESTDRQQTWSYLQAVGLVANAIAGLSGKPLTGGACRAVCRIAGFAGRTSGGWTRHAFLAAGMAAGAGRSSRRSSAPQAEPPAHSLLFSGHGCYAGQRSAA